MALSGTETQSDTKKDEKTLRLDRLFYAVSQVESGNDPEAHNKREDARGIIQIRSIMVRDVNRILGKDKYTHNDAWNKTKSKEMFRIYLMHYHKNGTDEDWAKSWNGVPRGPQKQSTEKYWKKVKKIYEQRYTLQRGKKS